MMFMSGAGLLLLGFFLQFNVFPLLTGHFIGLYVLLGGIGGLAFESHQRQTAMRLRVLALLALASAWVSLGALVFQIGLSLF